MAGEPAICGDRTIDLFAGEWKESESPNACATSGTPGDCTGDGDAQDDVLGVILVDNQVGTAGAPGWYDIIETGYAVRPCDQAACNPSNPYRFEGTKLLFLSNELDQGADLDGNGSIEDQDVVVKIDFCPGEEPVTDETKVAEVLGPVDPELATTTDPFSVVDGQTTLPSAFGRCALLSSVEDCSLPENPCGAGTVCDETVKRCVVATPAVCRLNGSDCTEQTECVPATVTVVDTIVDGDGDGLRDTVDPPDAASGCASAPLDGCRQLTRPGRSYLTLLEAGSAAKNRLHWRWLDGESTSLVEFGDPTANDDYELCLYDATGARRMEVSIPAGGTCGAGSRATDCWKEASMAPWATGYGYRNRGGAPEGMRSLRLKPGQNGKARIEAKGGGGLLDMPDLAALAAPLRVQLQGSHDECFDATFSRVRYKPKGNGTLLRAVSD